MRGDGVDQTRLVANGRRVADRWCSAVTNLRWVKTNQNNHYLITCESKEMWQIAKVLRCLLDYLIIRKQYQTIYVS